jgi:hypothetical protein
MQNDTDGPTFERRAILGGIGAGALVLAAGRGLAQEKLTDVGAMKPGEFTWHPERQRYGPVAVIVSLPQQLVHVYRNGVRIAVSTCSSGKPGHSTPTGVFVVLQKDKHHRSSTYNNAPMPNMNRLTWSGVALHAGNLPGYPASHGCVRLPLEFSEKLFDITHVGTPVIIAGAQDDPWELTHPGLVLGGNAAGQFKQIIASQSEKNHPSDWKKASFDPITSIIASSTDRRIMLIENGLVIANDKLTIAGGGRIGGRVFTLQARDSSGGSMEWVDISRSTRSGSFFRNESTLLARLTTTRKFAATMQSKMHPGTVLVLTDAPLHPDTRSGADFVIMS